MIATSLRDLEHLFWRSVRHDPAPAEMDRAALSSRAFSARDRIALYRRMYWYRQVDALNETFPTLAKMLGERRFTGLLCRYITAHPSEHPMLEWLGRELPAFVRSDLDTGDEPLLADVAALEWAQQRAFMAPDPPHVARADELPLARFAEAHLELVPSVVTCRVQPAAFAAVRAIANDAEPPACIGHSAARTLVVWRPDFFLRERLLDEDEAAALSLLEQREALGSVVAAFEAHPDPVRRAASCVLRWVADGLIGTVFVGGSSS